MIETTKFLGIDGINADLFDLAGVRGVGWRVGKWLRTSGSSGGYSC